MIHADRLGFFSANLINTVNITLFMVSKTLTALSAALSLYAGSALAEECAAPEKETEIGAMAAYVHHESEYGDVDGVQYRIGGGTVTNLYENLDLLLESQFVSNYFDYDDIGIQKDSFTDIFASLVYTGYPDYALGGGLSVFFYDGYGSYGDRDMQLTDYALGVFLKAAINGDYSRLSFNYALGFGEFGNNLLGENFSLKNRLVTSYDVFVDDFAANIHASTGYTYVPDTNDNNLEFVLGAWVEYRVVHYLALRAFYERMWMFGQDERQASDSVGAGVFLIF